MSQISTTSVASLLAPAGFEPFHTGGVFMAWRRDCGDGSHLLVSAEDELEADPASPVWIAGRYDDVDPLRYRETNGPRPLATALFIVAGGSRP